MAWLILLAAQVDDVYIEDLRDKPTQRLLFLAESGKWGDLLESYDALRADPKLGRKIAQADSKGPWMAAERLAMHLLRGAPAEAFDAYRKRVDAEARRLLGEKKHAEVVDGYFYSSVTVEAARASGDAARLERVRRYYPGFDEAAPAEAPAERPMPWAAPAIRDDLQIVETVDGMIRNEIRLFTHRFKEPAGVRRGNDYPLLPAAARIGGRDAVIITNGRRVTALALPGGKAFWEFGEPPADVVAPRALRATVATVLPYMGATIDGEHAFVTMRSAQARTAAPGFEHADRIVCLRVADGVKVWDTDEFYAEVDDKRCSQDWTFGGPPLVRGDRLYVGVTTGLDEPDCYVMCLDRASGKPVWRTFLCQASGRFGIGASATSVLPLTLLCEARGRIVAATGQGAVAGLDASDGAVEWLNLYERSMQPNGLNFLRPPGAPVAVGGRVYVLPQDAETMLVMDARTGERSPAPELPEIRKTGMLWRTFSRITGKIDDTLALAGQGIGAVFDVKTGRAHPLADGPPAWGAAGCLSNGYVYLPTEPSEGAKMSVIAAGTWLRRSALRWRPGDGSGNLSVIGPYVLVMDDALTVYMDSRALKATYAAALMTSPGDPDARAEYESTLKANGLTPDR